MAIQSQPSRIPEPFAGSGSKNVIPATNATPSASQAASWASGFPPECSQPISAGGCPVPRNDVNGALNQLSQDFAFRQDGGIWEWSALADYDAQRMVRGADGQLYWSVQPSGPGLASGAVDPTTDDGTFWVSPAVKTMDAGDSSSAAASTAWVASWFVNTVSLPVDLYVDPVNGNDANSGFSSSDAKSTIAAVVSLITSNSHISSAQVTIHLAPGSYTGQSLLDEFGVTIVYSATSGAAIFDTEVYVADNKKMILVGEYIINNNRIMCGYGGILMLTDGAKITFNNASKATAIQVYSGGSFYIKANTSASIGFSGSCTFSTAILVSTYSGIFSNYGTLSWFGSATGKRYQVSANSLVRGVGTNSIPGTAAGTADSTSYFS